MRKTFSVPVPDRGQLRSDNNLLLLTEIETRFLDHPARSLSHYSHCAISTTSISNHINVQCWSFECCVIEDTLLLRCDHASRCWMVSDVSTEHQKIVIQQTASHAKRTESTMTPLPTVTITIIKLSIWHQHLTSKAFKLRTFLNVHFNLLSIYKRH